MDSNCLTCGGLIMEPGKNYSYAGKVCHCFEDRVRRRATEPWIRPPFYVEEIKKLQKENAALILERDNYAKAMALALKEGVFARKSFVSNEITKLVGVPRGEEKES